MESSKGFFRGSGPWAIASFSMIGRRNLDIQCHLLRWRYLGPKTYLGGSNSNIFDFYPYLREMIQFD